MKSRRVALSPEAIADLDEIQEYIMRVAGVSVADGFMDRVELFIAKLDLASERGTLRDDIRPGLRVMGFEKRLTVAFAVTEIRVTVLRVFWGGRNWETEF